MGHLDQLAKQTFANETESVTGGAVTWQLVPEIGLTEIRADGRLVVLNPSRLTSLAWPWPAALGYEEILTEFKMDGDHLDGHAIERALLRRQARQVQRIEEGEPPWSGQQPLWLVAPSVPEVLVHLRELRCVGPGCYRVGPATFDFLWIAANQLPLTEELIPFLVARSGRALVEFTGWVTMRRPAAFVLRMLEVVSMPLSVQEEFRRYLEPSRLDDPVVREKSRTFARLMVELFPELLEEFKGEGIEKGREMEKERRLEPLIHQFERRLSRVLTDQEHQALRERATRLGSARLGDVVLDLSSEALAAWLSDPGAV